MSDKYSLQADADRERRREAADSFTATVTIVCSIRLDCDYESIEHNQDEAREAIERALRGVPDYDMDPFEVTFTDVEAD